MSGSCNALGCDLAFPGMTAADARFLAHSTAPLDPEDLATGFSVDTGGMSVDDAFDAADIWLSQHEVPEVPEPELPAWLYYVPDADGNPDYAGDFA